MSSFFFQKNGLLNLRFFSLQEEFWAFQTGLFQKAQFQKPSFRKSSFKKFEKTRNAATATPHMEDAWQMLTMRGKPHNAPRFLTHRAHTAQLTELHHVALKALNGLKLKGNENFNWRWHRSSI